MREREDTWSAKPQESDTSTGQSSLRDMLAQARDKARGQGVVQGSTMFFKNLAESVSQSHRNLKIGLAFLTLAFLVIAGSLSFMLYKAFQRQTETEQTIAQTIASGNKSMAENMQVLATSLDTLNSQLSELRKRMDTVESLARTTQQEVVIARTEARNVKQDFESVQRAAVEAQKSAVQLRGWVETFSSQYQKERDLIVKNMQGIATQQGARPQ